MLPFDPVERDFETAAAAIESMVQKLPAVEVADFLAEILRRVSVPLARFLDSRNNKTAEPEELISQHYALIQMVQSACRIARSLARYSHTNVRDLEFI